MEIAFLILGLLPLVFIPEFRDETEEEPDHMIEGGGSDADGALHPSIADDDFLYAHDYDGPVLGAQHSDDFDVTLPEGDQLPLKPVIEDDVLTLAVGQMPIESETDTNDEIEANLPVVLFDFNSRVDLVEILLENGEFANEQKVVTQASFDGIDGEIYLNGDLYAIVIDEPLIGRHNVTFAVAS